MNVEIFEPYFSAILISKLEPSDETVANMKEIIKYEEKEYLESTDNNSYVGDKTCFDKLHTFKEFEWLNQKVSNMLLNFIDTYRIKKNSCNFYIQKSWPVFLKNGDIGIMRHSHPNSHISFVYYLQTEANNETGQLHFNRGIDFWNNTVPYEDCSISFPAVTNNCFMFPSSMYHWVDQYFGDIPRISITYDITITSKNIPGLSNTEMLISDPVFWRKIDGKALST